MTLLHQRVGELPQELDPRRVIRREQGRGSPQQAACRRRVTAGVYLARVSVGNECFYQRFVVLR